MKTGVIVLCYYIISWAIIKRNRKLQEIMKGCEIMKPMTLTQAAAHYEGTGLTLTAIRRAVTQSEISHVRVGKKYLVTLEAIEAWLKGEKPKQG
jgi:excisionase family DNA binding protein